MTAMDIRVDIAPEVVSFQNLDESVLDVPKVIDIGNKNIVSVEEDPLCEIITGDYKEMEEQKLKKKRGRPSSWTKQATNPLLIGHVDEEQLKKMRSIGAERQRKRRARETPAEKSERVLKGRISLMKNRLLERLTLSDEQLLQKKAEISQKGRLWRQQKLKSMSEEQRSEHVRRKRLKKQYYRVRVSVLETPEEYVRRKQIERKKSSEALRARRARATPEQIKATRERARRYREAKRKRHEAMREINKLQKAISKKK